MSKSTRLTHLVVLPEQKISCGIQIENPKKTIWPKSTECRPCLRAHQKRVQAIIEERLRVIIAQYLMVPIKLVKSKALFVRHLAADIGDLARLELAIQEEFNLKISISRWERSFGRVSTLERACRYVWYADKK